MTLTGMQMHLIGRVYVLSEFRSFYFTLSISHLVLAWFMASAFG